MYVLNVFYKRYMLHIKIAPFTVFKIELLMEHLNSN